MPRSTKTGIVLLFSLLILALVWGQQVSAQTEPVRGQIIDKKTARPLAFVNITYLTSGQGTVSNIDGAFSIPSSQDIDFLKFSYVGYHPRFIAKDDIRPGEELIIELERKAYNIAEVKILPGINPAHRIIRLASNNRKLNNPEKHRSFSYTTYSKMYFTIDMDSMFQAGNDSMERDVDSSRQDLEKFLPFNGRYEITKSESSCSVYMVSSRMKRYLRVLPLLMGFRYFLSQIRISSS